MKMNPSKLRKLLEDFYRDDSVKMLAEKYCEPSIYDEVFGVSHIEKLHTGFIMWLVRQGCNVEGFLQSLKVFLKSVCESGLSQKCVSADVKEIYNLLSNPDTVITLQRSDIKKEVKTSYRYKGKKQKNPKVDIVINIQLVNGKYSKPVKIVIENKVFSREHDDQTKIYYSYFSADDEYIRMNLPDIDFYEKNNKGRSIRVYTKPLGELQLFIFLSPVDYELDCLACNKCEYFIPITYQYIYDYLLVNEAINVFPETEKMYIEEYKKILIKPTMSNFKIMAKDPIDKEKLKLFAEKYMPLFELAIRELGSSIAIEQIEDGIQQLSAQRYKYNLRIDDEKKWNSLKMHEVAHHIVEYLVTEMEISLKELNALFPNGYWVCDEKAYNKRKSESKQSEKRFENRWDKMRKLGLYVSKEWTKDRFSDFVNNVKTKYPIVIEQSN